MEFYRAIVKQAMGDGSATMTPMANAAVCTIELKEASVQSLSRNMRDIEKLCEEFAIPSDDEVPIHVAVHGDSRRKAIVTYHDIGFNYSTNFQTFFNFPEMRKLLEHFCVYHINAPGQESNAPDLPETFEYPSMDRLAQQIDFVLNKFGVKSFIGFGIGAGANVLMRYALNNSVKVEGLIVINCTSSAAGWIEWGYQKWNVRSLGYGTLTPGVSDYLIWHHLGKDIYERNRDLYDTYKYYFEQNTNARNLALFLDSYIQRTDLGIVRESDCSRRTTSNTLNVPVLNLTGSLSPHVDDTVNLNGRLNPENSSWMKISDCAMPLEEEPRKVAEAFGLFIKGLGYCCNVPS